MDTFNQNKLWTDFLSTVRFSSRETAEELLECLENLIKQYDVVTIADLKQLCEITFSFVDERWGWYNLDGSTVYRLRGDVYGINLPMPEPISDRLSRFDREVNLLAKQTDVISIAELRRIAEHAQHMVRVRPEGKDKEVAFTFLKFANNLLDKHEQEKVKLT